MKENMISILMPVFNGGNFLHDSIYSVLNQTFTNYEFLILNDGSTDNSKTIIQYYKDPRIKFIERENNFIKTLNYGLKIAQGKYIARMDADDIMLPERLEEQYNFMEKNVDVDLCGCGMKSFGNLHFTYKQLCRHIELRNNMIICNPIAHPTVIMRTSTIKKYSLHYKEEYKYAEDYKLWLDFLKVGKIANIDKVLLLYRISDNQISQQKRKLQELVTKKVQLDAIQQYIEEISTDKRSEIEEINMGLIQLVKQSVISFGSYTKCLYLIIKDVFDSQKNL